MKNMDTFCGNMRLAKYTCIFLFFLFSCNSNKSDLSYYRLDIGREMSVGAKKNITLDDIAELTRIIPIETNDSTLLSYASFVAVLDDKIVVCDRTKLLFVEKDGGKVTNILHQEGNGPGEYIAIGNVTLDKSNNDLYLFDIDKGMMMLYDSDLKYKKTLKANFMSSMQILDDGNFLITYSPLYKSEFCVGIYDKEWHLIQNLIHRTHNPKEFRVMPFNFIRNFNDGFYFSENHTDTIYNIANNSKSPFLVLDKRNYKMPIDLAKQYYTKRHSKYFDEGPAVLVNRYYFMEGTYNMGIYFDIWDIKKQELIYRNIMTENNKSRFIPVKVNEVTIDVWPSFVNGNYMYCLLNIDTATKILPSIPEDANPVILEFKIKE